MFFPPQRATQAHANLIRSDPEVGTVLPQAPQTVTLEFSEALDHDFSKAKLADSDLTVLFAADLSNPVPATDRSMSSGWALYEQNCVPCHGPEGKGDGPASLALRHPPVDLSVHTAPGVHPDGQRFEWITNVNPGSAKFYWLTLFRRQRTLPMAVGLSKPLNLSRRSPNNSNRRQLTWLSQHAYVRQIGHCPSAKSAYCEE